MRGEEERRKRERGDQKMGVAHSYCNKLLLEVRGGRGGMSAEGRCCFVPFHLLSLPYILPSSPLCPPPSPPSSPPPGKWTTYRSMAEETTDKVVELGGFTDVKECQTNGYILDGGDGWYETLFIRLIQDFGVDVEVRARSP